MPLTRTPRQIQNACLAASLVFVGALSGCIGNQTVESTSGTTDPSVSTTSIAPRAWEPYGLWFEGSEVAVVGMPASFEAIVAKPMELPDHEKTSWEIFNRRGQRIHLEGGALLTHTFTEPGSYLVRLNTWDATYEHHQSATAWVTALSPRMLIERGPCPLRPGMPECSTVEFTVPNNVDYVSGYLDLGSADETPATKVNVTFLDANGTFAYGYEPDPAAPHGDFFFLVPVRSARGLWSLKVTADAAVFVWIDGHLRLGDLGPDPDAIPPIDESARQTATEWTPWQRGTVSMLFDPPMARDYLLAPAQATLKAFPSGGRHPDWQFDWALVDAQGNLLERGKGISWGIRLNQGGVYFIRLEARDGQGHLVDEDHESIVVQTSIDAESMPCPITPTAPCAKFDFPVPAGFSDFVLTAEISGTIADGRLEVRDGQGQVVKTTSRFSIEPGLTRYYINLVQDNGTTEPGLWTGSLTTRSASPDVRWTIRYDVGDYLVPWPVFWDGWTWPPTEP